jgi:hypothetical protein
MRKSSEVPFPSDSDHGHPLQDVEVASALQRRFYRTIRETMRAMAGRLAGVAQWEAKKLLARHIWLDAEHADAIRQRVLELRFPRVDVDLEVDKALTAALAKVPSTRSDAEFLAGVYRVIKPAVLNALQRYLGQSDRLDDAPSHRALRFVIEELQDQLHEFDTVWTLLPENERAQAGTWEAWLGRSRRGSWRRFGQTVARSRWSFRPRALYNTHDSKSRCPLVAGRDTSSAPATAHAAGAAGLDRH